MNSQAIRSSEPSVYWLCAICTEDLFQPALQQSQTPPRSRSMKPAFCFRISLLAAIIFLVPSVASWGQQPPAIAASTTMPSLITMCEDSDGCSDWGFKGSQGIGLWATGANADLTITHLDATTIAIH